MRALIPREVAVAAPADAVWGYVTDWPRQEEWIPLTRVEAVDSGDRTGGRIRAWTGLGGIGFWDTMTITTWETDAQGGGRCEILHTGAVVRGEGAFTVTADGAERSRLVWWERVEVPGGPLGALAWRLVGPVVNAFLGRLLARAGGRVEELHGSR
jgi:carbon monoxide dehydrogenase subunit G